MRNGHTEACKLAPWPRQELLGVIDQQGNVAAVQAGRSKGCIVQSRAEAVPDWVPYDAKELQQQFGGQSAMRVTGTMSMQR